MGFRNVSLNLAISTPLTRMLGVDYFLCELQLVLRHFAEIQASPFLPPFRTGLPLPFARPSSCQSSPAHFQASRSLSL